MTVSFVNTDTTWNTYATTALLTAAPSARLANGTYAVVTGYGVYKLAKNSTSTVDNINVVASDVGTDQWILSYTQHLIQNSTAVIDQSQILGANNGGSLASANNLTVPVGASFYTVTGTTTINLISTIGWSSGDQITLQFASTPTVAYNQTPATGFAALILSAHVNITTITANSTLTLVYNGTTWSEVGRCIV